MGLAAASFFDEQNSHTEAALLSEGQLQRIKELSRVLFASKGNLDMQLEPRATAGVRWSGQHEHADYQQANLIKWISADVANRSELISRYARSAATAKTDSRHLIDARRLLGTSNSFSTAIKTVTQSLQAGMSVDFSKETMELAMAVADRWDEDIDVDSWAAQLAADVSKGVD
ncbi:MAG: hypothetical protein V7752_07060 [Halopseudomonas sp.]